MANIFDLTGRVAVITGCSTGLGVQMAKELWGDRFEVVITTHLDREHIQGIQFQDIPPQKGRAPRAQNYNMVR